MENLVLAVTYLLGPIPYEMVICIAYVVGLDVNFKGQVKRSSYGLLS